MDAVAPAPVSTADSPETATTVTTRAQGRPWTSTPRHSPAAPPNAAAQPIRRIRAG